MPPYPLLRLGVAALACLAEVLAPSVAAPQHLRFFSFYTHGDDDTLAAQRGIVNVRLGHDAHFDTQRRWWTRRPDGSLATNFSDVLSLGKPVVLNFWAGDCPPCRAEMPAFQRVYEEFSDRVIFLGLDVGVFTGLGTRNSAFRLLDELGITYPAGAPPSRTSVVRYSVVSMPTTVFFDANGKIIDRIDGAMSEFRLATEIDELLAAS